MAYKKEDFEVALFRALTMERDINDEILVIRAEIKDDKPFKYEVYKINGDTVPFEKARGIKEKITLTSISELITTKKIDYL
jgi:hypothetical protein